MGSERFPVLEAYTPALRHLRKTLGCPNDVPWSLLAPHEERALRNHDQTLNRLAERGGLAPSEMVAVLENRPWHSMTDAAAVARLLELLAASRIDTSTPREAP